MPSTVLQGGDGLFLCVTPHAPPPCLIPSRYPGPAPVHLTYTTYRATSKENAPRSLRVASVHGALAAPGTGSAKLHVPLPCFAPGRTAQMFWTLLPSSPASVAYTCAM